MAKIHSDYLINKYGSDKIKNKRYQRVIQEILLNQQKNISNKISKLESEHWKKALNKISTKEKQFILPDVQEVLPKRSVFIIKSAEKGKMLTDTIKDKLTKDLRNIMTEYKIKGGKTKYIIRGGKKTGVISPKIIKEFENKITETFTEYTKKNPKFNMPTNIHAIAVTETRSTINNIKQEYMKELKRKNPDLKIKKQWIHNPSLSKYGRLGHIKQNGKTINEDEMFAVENWTTHKKPLYLGITYMTAPHDKNAGAEQVICCNCDVIYYISK